MSWGGRACLSAGFVLFKELSFCDSSLSESAIFSEGSSTDFECFDDFELLWSCCFEPCFDFGFCSEATEAESCYFVDGADGDTRGDDTCVSADGGFGGGRGHGCGHGCWICHDGDSESQNGENCKGILWGLQGLCRAGFGRFLSLLACALGVRVCLPLFACAF